MAIHKISIAQWLLMPNQLVLDVRSPSEYAHAHIPGAISVPLFSDEERKVIGTAYKQQSKQTAIKLGLRFFGPQMLPLLETVELLIPAPIEGLKRSVILYCWRGGMRSAGVAWLLDLYGFDVYTIIGGYKSYRRWGLAQMEQPYRLAIVGGSTGSAKTATLQAIAAKGGAMIDLEALAHHKGSAFGNINMPAQPSQEMFENKLALALYQQHAKCLPQQSIWLEDESQRIGKVNIPLQLFRYMRKQPFWLLKIPFDARLAYITSDYGKGQTEELVNAIIRIKKRLGGLETQTAIAALIEGDVEGCFRILLAYYDRLYKKSNTAHIGENGQSPNEITLDNIDPEKCADLLLKSYEVLISGTYNRGQGLASMEGSD